jgi:hypothetical protein
LLHESPQLRSKYPFAYSTNVVNPLESRFLVNMRSKSDFDNVNKYSTDNDPQKQAAKRQSPYQIGKHLRALTKGRYSLDARVVGALENTDGAMQKKTIQ